MGNCMETCKLRQQEDEIKTEEQELDGFAKEDGFEKGGLRVKIVLTKKELESLMFKLKRKDGKRLEDVLGEIEKERGTRRDDDDVKGWTPTLESIMEGPEVHEMNR